MSFSAEFETLWARDDFVEPAPVAWMGKQEGTEMVQAVYTQANFHDCLVSEQLSSLENK